MQNIKPPKITALRTPIIENAKSSRITVDTVPIAWNTTAGINLPAFR